mmetsp:Transcript_99489/g.197147  ORF Transcript_99489/g.197147 Transcript_99489/m.197147 type:complete len:194 (+) Transcript_99489:85-666(+)|eukprot:CAMPEP_0172718360 /NCGR_PEP_ID=MMETSP1074-20121228/74128_1 /TAXON_ID=2916 /ORGANISM="Ceratium fusus, Strain PA161109" /LENGTH=193 /DNA_ID=CAMNT_0013543523 /DNA_START=82 /DNA_END=663 /DNA_ORIENTATION=+
MYKPLPSPQRRIATALLASAAVCVMFGHRPLNGGLASVQPGIYGRVPHIGDHNMKTSVSSIFRCGDRVKARAPILLSNQGRGYFNEGKGKGVPEHLLDLDQEAEEQDNLTKIIEGGSEGTVCGIIKKGEWAQRPLHWTGHKRPGVMVSWDDANLPMDVAMEVELELIEAPFREQMAAQRKNSKEKMRLRTMSD